MKLRSDAKDAAMQERASEQEFLRAARETSRRIGNFDCEKKIRRRNDMLRAKKGIAHRSHSGGVLAEKQNRPRLDVARAGMNGRVCVYRM